MADGVVPDVPLRGVREWVSGVRLREWVESGLRERVSEKRDSGESMLWRERVFEGVYLLLAQGGHLVALV